MLNKTLQKYNLKYKELQKQLKALDLQIDDEQKLYLESKVTMEKNIGEQTKVDNLNVNMLTFTPDLAKIKDEDIEQIINQY